MSGATVIVKCARCGDPFVARVADRKRGWGKFCSKSCKAIKQEQRTGQHARYLERKDEAEKEGILYEATTFHGQDGTGGV